ncbi:MAG: FAD-binding oxidoreductase [Candidatus Anstonellales archaeon]
MIYETFVLRQKTMLNKNTAKLVFDRKINATPGQFVLLWLPGIGEKPYGIANDSPFTLVVKDVGKVSNALVSLKKGKKIWVRGPFGRGFEIKKGKGIGVVGGYGIAPVGFLSKKTKIKMLVGAKTKEDLIFVKDKGVEYATNDGTYGHMGLITDLLEKELKTKKYKNVYACGPEPMLFAVGKISEKFKINAQLLTERHMKCGIGICGSCALGGKLVCKHGPMFYWCELKNKEDFGK